jgi:hypothetical protein
LRKGRPAATALALDHYSEGFENAKGARSGALCEVVKGAVAAAPNLARLALPAAVSPAVSPVVAATLVAVAAAVPVVGLA